MTQQIDDLFRYKGIEYAVCGISQGESIEYLPLFGLSLPSESVEFLMLAFMRELFDLSSLGLSRFPAKVDRLEGLLFRKLILDNSACWRGYQAVFSVLDSCLVLDTLDVNLYDYDEESGRFTRCEGPPVNGVSPTGPGERHSFCNNFYVGLGYRLQYTGGLLLGDGLIEGLRTCGVFRPAWTYANVIELVFDQGMLVTEVERSEPMAELRKQILEDCPNGDFKNWPTSPELQMFVVFSGNRVYKSAQAPLLGLKLPDPQEWGRSHDQPRIGGSLLARIARSQETAEAARIRQRLEDQSG